MVGKVKDSRLTLLGNDVVPAAFAKDMARLGQINRVKHAFDTTTVTIVINALFLASYITAVMCGATPRSTTSTGYRVYKILRPVLLVV